MPVTNSSESSSSKAKDWDTDDASTEPKRRKRPLSEKQSNFVSHYCAQPDGNASEAARLAGYSHKGSAAALMSNQNIIDAIRIHREGVASKCQFTESQIMARLWGEANYYDDGATHAGRINALVWLGKHMGMFDPNAKKLAEAKSAKGGNTYNIINYSGATNTLEDQHIKEAEIHQAIERKEKDVLEAVATDSTALAGVTITSY